MRKILFVTLILSILLAGCSTNSNEIKATTEDISTKVSENMSHTMIDQYQNTVNIPENIERIGIVQLLPLPSVFVAYQGGKSDNLVFMPPDSLNATEKSILKDYSPDLLNVSTKPLENGQINIEEILNLNPDIIFYSGKDNAELFKSAGIPAVGFSTTAGGKNPIITVSKWIEQLEEVFRKDSKLTGILDYGNEVIEDVKNRVSKVPEDDKKKILMLATFDDSTIRQGGFSDYWISEINGINILDNTTSTDGTLNIEQIYEFNPDIIFISSLASVLPEDFYTNNTPDKKDWSNILAVKNKQVYKFPTGMHRWWPPTPESPLSLYWQAKLVYPGYFEDIDIEELTREYFKNFLNMELTDQQVKNIFTPIKDLGLGGGK